jgi:hypothetical protein
VIDNSGFIVVHPDYITNGLPKEAEHIMAKELALAMDLIQSGVMKSESCIQYVNYTLQSYREVCLDDKKS